MERPARPELIKPYVALKSLEHLYGGSIDAKKLIADKVRDGEIRAFAKRSWISTEGNLKAARNAEPPPRAARNKAIDRSKLIGAESWSSEAPLWKWQGSVFHSVITSQPIKRRIFTGVRFAKDDIERLVKAAKAARQKDASNAGAPRKSEAWDAVWLAILEIATDGPFTEERLGQQQQMVTTVLRKFGPKDSHAPLSPAMIEATVSKIYERFFPGRQN